MALMRAAWTDEASCIPSIDALLAIAAPRALSISHAPEAAPTSRRSSGTSTFFPRPRRRARAALPLTFLVWQVDDSNDENGHATWLLPAPAILLTMPSPEACSLYERVRCIHPASPCVPILASGPPLVTRRA